MGMYEFIAVFTAGALVFFAGVFYLGYCYGVNKERSRYEGPAGGGKISHF
jgi:hypothetical protein